MCIVVGHRITGAFRLDSLVLEEAAAPPECGTRPRTILLSMFRALGSIIGRKDAFASMGRVGTGMLSQVQAGLRLTHSLVYCYTTGQSEDALREAGEHDREARIAASAAEMVLNAWNPNRRGILKVSIGVLLSGSGISATARRVLEGMGIALKRDNVFVNYSDADTIGEDNGVTDTRVGNAIQELSAVRATIFKNDNLGWKRGAAAGRNNLAAWLQIVQMNFEEVARMLPMWLMWKHLRPGLKATPRPQLCVVWPDPNSVVAWDENIKGDGQALLDRADQIIGWVNDGLDVKTIKVESRFKLPNLVNLEVVDPATSTTQNSLRPATFDVPTTEADDIANAELDETLAAIAGLDDAAATDGRSSFVPRALHVKALKEDLNAIATVMIMCKYRIRVHFGLLMRLAKADKLTERDRQLLRDLGVENDADRAAYLEFKDEIGCWTSGDGSPMYTMIGLSTKPAYGPWRRKVAADVNTEHPDLQQVLGYKLDEHKVGDLVGDLVDGKLHWIVELFGLRGEAFWNSHLHEVTKQYRKTPGRQEWILHSSLPRQPRMEHQEANAAQIIGLHTALLSILRALGAATDSVLEDLIARDLEDVAAAAQEEGEEEGEGGNNTALFLRHSADAFVEFIAVFSSRTDLHRTGTPIDTIKSGLASFSQSWICGEDLYEYFVFRAFDEPAVMPLHHEHRHMGSALNMIDTERRFDGTPAEAKKFQQSQSVGALFAAGRHAYKYCRLYCHVVMQRATASQTRLEFMDRETFARPYGKNGTHVWLDRGQEWTMEKIRYFEGHKDRGGNKFQKVERTIERLNDLTAARHNVSTGDQADLEADRQRTRGQPFLTSQAFPEHLGYLEKTNTFGPGPLRSFTTGKPRLQHGDVSISGQKLEPRIAEYPLDAQAAINDYVRELYYDGPVEKVGVRFPKRCYTDDERVTACAAEQQLFTTLDWRKLGMSGRKTDAICKDASFLVTELKWRFLQDETGELGGVCDRALTDATAVNGDAPLTPKETEAAKVCGARKHQGIIFPDDKHQWSTPPAAVGPPSAAGTPAGLPRSRAELLASAFYRTSRRAHSKPYPNDAVSMGATSTKDDLEQATTDTVGW